MGTSRVLPADPAHVRLFTSQSTWIEGSALEQLTATAKLAGVVHAAAFPDLHPGKGFPVGAAFVTRDVLYPILAGNDIGCGMSFFAAGLSVRKLKLERWAKRLAGLEQPWDGDIAPLLQRFDLPESLANAGLGTIGGGNHFAELQVVDEIRDAAAFGNLSLDRDEACLLVHSGSRGLGQTIFRDVLVRHGANPTADDSDEAREYVARHDHAVRFARANRRLIAERFLGQISGSSRIVSDVAHNLVTREDWNGASAWIHRKGAASLTEARAQGCLMIPGSRGTRSFLVAAKGCGQDAAHSIAHGAGRRWQRGYAKSRLSHKFRVGDLERTGLGGHVICEDRELIYDEAPQAYKDIEAILSDLEEHGLCSVVAVYRPVLTYKVRRASDD
jgi:release factor H-coupled RctB family protein